MSELEQKEKWPEGLLEEYGRLSLPSLYDFILSQEKLAIEIRKQNKELMRFSEILGDLNQEIKETLEERFEEISEPQSIRTNDAAFLMEVMDLFYSLSQATETTTLHILKIVPNRCFFRTPPWRTSLEGILKGYGSGIEIVRNKILGMLADAGISVIFPEQNEAFDPQVHRAVGKISGGERCTIATIVRYGYRTNDQILRYADVTIYEEI